MKNVIANRSADTPFFDSLRTLFWLSISKELPAGSRSADLENAGIQFLFANVDADVFAVVYQLQAVAGMDLFQHFFILEDGGPAVCGKGGAVNAPFCQRLKAAAGEGEGGLDRVR